MNKYLNTSNAYSAIMKPSEEQKAYRITGVSVGGCDVHPAYIKSITPEQCTGYIAVFFDRLGKNAELHHYAQAGEITDKLKALCGRGLEQGLQEVLRVLHEQDIPDTCPPDPVPGWPGTDERCIKSAQLISTYLHKIVNDTLFKDEELKRLFSNDELTVFKRLFVGTFISEYNL